ncbi:MAG: gliding motility-associated C-terminal domain-containing protein [Bacteroidia bacterium]|nr:gliding motility-associated C-terminal domain-containing protein [Bacteroidia bacterium]
MNKAVYKYLLLLMLLAVLAPGWGQTDTLCTADPTGSYHVRGQEGSTFIWDTHGNGEIIEGQGNDSIRVVWNSTASTYLLSVLEVSEEGCAGDQRLLNIQVLNPEMSLLGQPVCSEDRQSWSVQLSTSGTPSLNGAGVLSQQSAGAWLVDHIPEGTDLSVAIRVGNCESSYVINAPDCRCPEMHAEISADTAICLADTIVLTARGGSTYVWNTGDTTASIRVSPPADSTFTVVVAEGVCSDTANVLVRVNPLPEVFAGEDTTVIYGTRAYLNGQAAQDIVWEPALYLDCPECAETSGIPLATTTYCIQAENEYGCIASDCVVITVDTLCDGLFIPNVFAPEAGGHKANDCLRLYGTSCIGSMALSIYSRWGELVYQSESVADCWDGTFRGQALNAGVFVYQLHATLITGEEITRQGNITLMR